MNDDPEELKDISDKPSSKKIMKDLFKELLKLQKESGDTFELEPIYPELAKD